MCAVVGRLYTLVGNLEAAVRAVGCFLFTRSALAFGSIFEMESHLENKGLGDGILLILAAHCFRASRSYLAVRCAPGTFGIR